MFHAFESMTDKDLYAITDEPEGKRLPQGTWRYFKAFPDTDEPRVAFPRERVKAEIAEKGFSLVGVKITITEHVGRSS